MPRAGRRPRRLSATHGTDDGGLVVTGPGTQLSAYVADLVRDDIGLLGFTPTETPLEALFFMLTDDRDRPADEACARRTGPEESGAVR